MAKDGAGAQVKLFRSRDEAEQASREGLVALAEHAIKPDLSGIDYALAKDLKALHLLWLRLGTGDALLAGSKSILRRHLVLGGAPLLPLQKAAWETRVREARLKTTGLVASYVKSLKLLLEQRDMLLAQGDKAYPGAVADMEALLPKDFLDRYEYADFPRLARWMRGRLLRRERHIASPFKDAEKAAKFKPYAVQAENFVKLRPADAAQRAALTELSRLMEEFRISVFAPEVGTEGRVSPAILDTKIAELKRLFALK